MAKNMNRREAIKLITGAGVALYLSSTVFNERQSLAFAKPRGGLSAKRLAEISPINRTLPDVAPREFFADYPEQAHKVLWDKAGFIASNGGSLPSASEEVPLVIIGGGLSGLASTFLLRKYNPILLEQAPRFGGNAKGQSWNGIDYSIGAAYFVEPEPKSEIDEFLKAAGFRSKGRVKTGEDPVTISGKIFHEFWKSESVKGDKKAEKQFSKLAKYFQDANNDEEVRYPNIPITDESQRGYIEDLDRVSLLKHAENIAGEPLHPHIITALEHYCWSSFGGSATEVSAASGLNFYACEFSGLCVMPGGNSAVTEHLVHRIGQKVPEANIRPSSLVFNVKAGNNGVDVSYVDSNSHIHTLRAKCAVLACPKFVVGKILEDIEPERLNAIRKLRYRSYLVANLLLKESVKNPFYDIYHLGEGNTDASNAMMSSQKQQITDVILANYASPPSKSKGSKNTVLTLYRGIPYDGARGELLAPDSYERFRAEFETKINDTILPLLKLKKENIVDLRIARWGHPLPLAAAGLIADGTLAAVRKPFGERVFFVEQDNWALPAFETAVIEAMLWAPEVEKVLRQSTRA